MTINCISCKLRNESKNALRIANFKHFYIQQDYEIAILGFFVIASKRHIIGFADFTDAEKKEFIDILCKLRKIMRDKLNIKYVTSFVRESIIENKKSASHFHFALLPEYKWMSNLSFEEIFEHAKKNPKPVEELVKKARRYFK